MIEVTDPPGRPQPSPPHRGTLPISLPPAPGMTPEPTRDGNASDAATSFTKAVRAVVASTQPGEVMTYGEVAQEAGFPGAARGVSAALRGAGLPWWRVVAAGGRIVAPSADEQIARLRDEGHTIDGEFGNPRVRQECSPGWI